MSSTVSISAVSNTNTTDTSTTDTNTTEVKAPRPATRNARRSAARLVLVGSVLTITSCAHPAGNVDSSVQFGPKDATVQMPEGSARTVQASFYGEGDGFRGRRTASGERLSPVDFTAAHRTLPFGTVLQLRDPASGRAVRVRVNDRGPFVKGRTLDLSPAAASELGMKDRGVALVEMRIVHQPTKRADTLQLAKNIPAARRKYVRAEVLETRREVRAASFGADRADRTVSLSSADSLAEVPASAFRNVSLRLPGTRSVALLQ